ncbi:hypothetical protein GTQ40_12460 [Flavobacteriaceae bacterium R38]|nr:hypothetical protein [Flavobacteriaceae bacterium R38]
MRIVTIVLIMLAVCLIGYNITKIDFEAPLSGESFTAVIGIMASLCAILVLTIFTISKKIQKKIKDR